MKNQIETQIKTVPKTEMAYPQNRTEINTIFRCKDVSIYYNDFTAIKELNMDIFEKSITTLIGPSGCGKSTLLRSFNRMNDFVDGFRIDGNIFLEDEEIYSPEIDPVNIRLKVGMVFQSPNPFPKNIQENIALGPRLNGYTENIEELVESSLKRSYLWDEVKDKLKKSAYSLSGGQQQRLCIARAIAMEPNVLLMDEPTSALDPVSTAKIEELIEELKENYTIIIVTHNMQQAARIGDYTGFFYQGKLIEYGKTGKLYTNPSNTMTEDYITGRFG